MNKKPNYYWMYSQYSIESALLNPKRKIIELLIEKIRKFYSDLLKRCNYTKKK